ncbi:CopD family protein [Woeseia oceani]|uniref:Protoporphyrinogen IX oxidase n=1 Tax=Woeseia oceani TaxID=1548547 RepID=A0A193LCW9_9GAMM|nr:CopD family protein [Woeseia oceani]ANO50385.1 hypothetical protein BA177_03395 [Woeseia oceani]
MQLGQWYPWVKALHVAFMVTWFAGLFYLPRLFIYHAEASDSISLQRFQVMERRLYAMMTLGATVTIILGLLLLWINPGLLMIFWFRLKLLLLAGLIVFHLRCRNWMNRLKGEFSPENTRWLRFFNEIPVIFLLGIITLAILKPA